MDATFLPEPATTADPEPMQAAALQRRPASRPRIVIVGAGFGGLTAAKALAKAPADITVIDRRNYHLFQPLLYQVATAGLSPADIASPIRAILGRQANTTVLLGKVTGIDTATRDVLIDAQRIPYDYLIVATGARHAYFGREEWANVAPGLKKIEDATDIRRRILTAFEKAENTADAAERRGLLTFVVVGGGPTGVELAGAIAELARRALAKDFRNIDPGSARVLLVEAGPRLLAAFPAALSARATQSLEKLGVETRFGRAVTACDDRRRRNQRRAYRRRHDNLGGRRHGLPRREVAGGGEGSCRPRSRRRQSLRSRTQEYLCHRRHGAEPRSRQQARSRHRTRRQAAGKVCQPADPRAASKDEPHRAHSAIAIWAISRPSAAAPLSPISAGSDSTARLPGCCGGSSTSFPHRLSQSRRRAARLAVVLRHLPARLAPHHRITAMTFCRLTWRFLDRRRRRPLADELLDRLRRAGM